MSRVTRKVQPPAEESPANAKGGVAIVCARDGGGCRTIRLKAPPGKEPPVNSAPSWAGLSTGAIRQLLIDQRRAIDLKRGWLICRQCKDSYEPRPDDPDKLCGHCHFARLVTTPSKEK
jgi:hypothetical protein